MFMESVAECSWKKQDAVDWSLSLVPAPFSTGEVVDFCAAP